MDIKQQTQNVAAQGRYGDSMLMHVNPAEVKGLASALPLTVNPQTGQPEAFLPFLAPLIGSALGTSLLTAGGLAGLSMSPALAAGLGAGLATYAESGGSGSKALLSGLTAGFGTNAANTAAQSAVTDAATQANIAGTSTLAAGIPMAPEAAATAAQQAALATPRAATGSFNALTDTFSGGFDQGAKALASGAMSPSGMLAGAAAGSRGIIESQEAFARQMGESEEEYRRRREEMYRNTPEPILYSAGGGIQQFDEGGLVDNFLSGDYGMLGMLNNNPELMFGATGLAAKNNFRGSLLGELYNQYRKRKDAGDEVGAAALQSEIQNEESMQMAAGGGATGYYEGGRFGEIPDNITGGNLPQIYAPAKQAYDVNPDFMAGFSPETMYFNPATISAPASGLGAGGPPIAIDNYQGSKGGYGGRQASIAPQTSIDPFSAYTGSAPKGLEFTETAPPMPKIPFPINPITPPDFDIGVPDIGRIDIPNIGNIDIQSIIDQYGYDAPERAMTGMDLGLPMGEGTPMPAGTMMQANDLGALLPPGTDNGIDISDFLGSREDTLGTAKDIFGPQVEFATSPVEGSNYMMTAAALEDMGITPQPVSGGGLGGLFGGLTPQEPIVSEMNTQVAPALDVTSVPALDVLDPVVAKQVVDIPTYNYNDPARLARIDDYFASDRFASASGGSTNFQEGGALKPIPEDNKGLPNLPKDVRKEMGYMQEGGMTDMQSDPLTKEVTMFILGETDNEQALNDFITKYGSDAFMQLREMVLQSIVPDAQTQGLIQGDGEGGMDDDLRGMIGDKQRIAVSQDEFIVPADVVSMLGDGSSDAGSKELYDMMDRVRQKKTGTTKQAPKLANAGGMLPA